MRPQAERVTGVRFSSCEALHLAVEESNPLRDVGVRLLSAHSKRRLVPHFKALRAETGRERCQFSLPAISRTERRPICWIVNTTSLSVNSPPGGACSPFPCRQQIHLSTLEEPTMHRALLSIPLILIFSLQAGAQSPAKPTQESRPADPRPAVTELNLNVNPDTQFYKLATGARMENNATTSWTIDTLGFREIRLVVSMGADSKKENRATGSSLMVNAFVNEGEQEVEIGEMEVPISAGKSSGRAFVWNVFNSRTVIRVTARNISGSATVTAYAVK